MTPELTKEELNALLVVCAGAQIKGSDAQFMAALMAKLKAMLETTSEE